MNPALVIVIWLLVTLDSALMGYRLAMGRNALLDKRRYYQRASIRAGLIGQAPIAAVTVLALLLIATGPPGLGQQFNNAATRLILVGGPYAVVILATSALCALPSVTVRSAASVLVFGPLTLLRPLVAIAAVAAAVAPDPQWQLVVVGILVAVPGVCFEPLADHRVGRQLTVGHSAADPDSSNPTVDIVVVPRSI